MSEPERWRARPVVVEALRVSEAIRAVSKDWRSLPSWLSEAYARHRLSFGTEAIFLNGKTIAGHNDWIVVGVEGEIFPVRASVFEASYEPVEESAHA